MRSIVARGVNFGMAVAYMISAEQRAISLETVAKLSMNISWHSGICLNTSYFLRPSAPSYGYGWVHHLVGASKVL